MEQKRRCALTSPPALERWLRALLVPRDDAERTWAGTASNLAATSTLPFDAPELVRRVATAARPWAGQPLLGDQIRALREIFGDSVDYAQVRVCEGFEELTGGRGFGLVLGNNIYLDTRRDEEASSLVHEMTHVWQYQQGGCAYLTRTLLGQGLGKVDPTSGKSSLGEQLLSGAPWAKLGAEEQATLLAAAFDDAAKGSGRSLDFKQIWSGDERGKGFDLAGYTAGVVRAVQSGQGAP